MTGRRGELKQEELIDHEKRERLTSIPALLKAMGIANIPVPTFPLIMCIMVEKFLQNKAIKER